MKSEYTALIIGIIILCLIPITLKVLRYIVKRSCVFVWNLTIKGVKIFFKVLYAIIKYPFTKNKYNWRALFGLKPKKFDLDLITKNEMGEKIDPRLAGYRFEKFIQGIYQSYGYECYQGRAAKSVPGLYPPELMSTNGDGGVDLIAFGKNEILIIQTKLQNSSVKGEHIAKTAAVRDIFINHYNKKDNRIVKAILVTNSKIDNTAKMFCNSQNVYVYQKEDLDKLITCANKRYA